MAWLQVSLRAKMRRRINLKAPGTSSANDVGSGMGASWPVRVERLVRDAAEHDAHQHRTQPVNHPSRPRG